VHAYRPVEHMMGRMAGTGTGVGGTDAAGCQLRWRFFGGPELMVEDAVGEEITQVHETLDV